MNDLWVTILTAFLTALITSAFTFLGYWRKAKAELQKEYESRFNERKWKVYTKFVRLQGQTIEAALANDLDFLVERHDFEIICDLLLVASDEVIKAYNEYSAFQLAFLRKVNRHQRIEDEEIRMEREKRMAIVSAMRKDLGYKSKASSGDLWTMLATLKTQPSDLM